MCPEALRCAESGASDPDPPPSTCCCLSVTSRLVTAGYDANVKVWDVRTFKPIHTYYSSSPATAVDISQRGLLAVGYGPHVQIWKDALTAKASAPYMNHLIPGATLEDLQFVPFEDVLGIGHSRGFSSILVPGAGEPNIDALAANPFQTVKQRQESEVKALLEKVRVRTVEHRGAGRPGEGAAGRKGDRRRGGREKGRPGEGAAGRRDGRAKGRRGKRAAGEGAAGQRGGRRRGGRAKGRLG